MWNRKIIGLFLVWFMSLFFGSIVTASNGIWNVFLQFCQNKEVVIETWAITSTSIMKHLHLDLVWWKDSDVCMQLTNKGSEDITLRLWFVDATVTNDSFKHKACKDEWATTNFWQYVNWPKEVFFLPAWATVEKHATINFPEWFGGDVFGCVTYYQAKEVIGSGSADMFKVVVRKANFIDVSVSGNIQLWLEMLDIKQELAFVDLTSNPKIGVFYDESEKNLLVHAWVKNIGTIAQSVIITWTISNAFGYSQNFLFDDTKILPKESLILRNSIDNLPFYKWPFSIDINVSYIPAFDWQKYTGELTLSYLEETADFFLMSDVLWWIVWLFIFLLLILILLKFKRYYVKKRKQKKEIKLNKKLNKKLSKKINKKKAKK